MLNHLTSKNTKIRTGEKDPRSQEIVAVDHSDCAASPAGAHID